MQNYDRYRFLGECKKKVDNSKQIIKIKSSKNKHTKLDRAHQGFLKTRQPHQLFIRAYPAAWTKL